MSARRFSRRMMLDGRISCTEAQTIKAELDRVGDALAPDAQEIPAMEFRSLPPRQGVAAGIFRQPGDQSLKARWRRVAKRCSACRSASRCTARRRSTRSTRAANFC